MKHYTDTSHATEARKRKVVMITGFNDRTVFSSIKEAAEQTGLFESCICRCCKGQLGRTGGARFKYYDE